MALEVLPQVGRQVAAVAAQMALMRPLIAVPDAHVQLEIPLRRKGLVALRTGEGPLLQVHRGDMASQVAGEREALLVMRTNLSHGCYLVARSANGNPPCSVPRILRTVPSRLPSILLMLA